MKIVALTPTREDGWILGFSVRAALQWCDHVIILNHCGTEHDRMVIADLIAEHFGRVQVMSIDDPEWREADYRQKLLEAGRSVGGTHFALLDADECVTANLLAKNEGRSIHSLAGSLEPGQCLKLPWICLWRSIYTYRKDDSTFGRARAATVFADAPNLSFQSQPGGYQIHTRIPHGARIVMALDRDQGGLMHFQHVRWRCLLMKQLHYQMQEVVRWPGRSTAAKIAAKYRPTTDETLRVLGDVPLDWMDAYWKTLKLIDVKDVSWHEGAVRKLIADHGKARFAGLDAFGLFEF